MAPCNRCWVLCAHWLVVSTEAEFPCCCCCWKVFWGRGSIGYIRIGCLKYIQSGVEPSPVYQKIFIYILTAIKIFLVTYSRVYTGRHSFDQLISGISLGLFCTHFSTFYFVPNYYNHIMDWNRKHDNWKYFRYSVIFFISFLVSADIIFLYVDKNVPIPNEWYT